MVTKERIRISFHMSRGLYKQLKEELESFPGLTLDGYLHSILSSRNNRLQEEPRRCRMVTKLGNRCQRAVQFNNTVCSTHSKGKK